MKQRSNTTAGETSLHDIDGQGPHRERLRTALGPEGKRHPASGSGDAYARLTGRERWVVSALIRHKGAPNKVIAYALKISPNTLRNHLASIYGKLGVRRRVELVVYALEQGLDALPDTDGQRSTSEGR